MEEKKKPVCIKILQNGKRCEKLATKGNYCDDHFPSGSGFPGGGRGFLRRGIEVARAPHRG